MSMTPKAFLKSYPALVAKHGSQRKVAKKLGIPRSTIQRWLENSAAYLYTETAPLEPYQMLKPHRGVKRFIFTAAQDETAVHEQFLKNLLAYSDYMNAELIVGGFTYNKRAFDSSNPHLYAPEIEPYLCNRQIEIGDNLLFCGEMNTLPTATSPLSGFETYTRDKWGIFPHAKVQLASIATMKNSPAKMIMTTGAVTKPNYVQMRAGIRAHFHHVIGAVIVEIDSDGDHFCRHLLGEDDGSFYDTTRRVENGVVLSEDFAVEAITWGDLHTEKLDPIVREACWGIGNLGAVNTADSMLDTLQPRFQFMHDTTDFSARNHHSVSDPHFILRSMYHGQEEVEFDMKDIACFLEKAQRSWCKTVIVESNHDLAFTRWLREGDWKNDPVNAEYFLEAQLYLVRQIKSGANHISMLKWAMTRLSPSLSDCEWLHQDESFMICNETIECGIHGHNGANGSRGTPRQFTKMGPKANTGHTHSASINDGIYTVGTSSKLDLSYNHGLSSWSHSHILTYKNGKRTIITMQNGKWEAQ